MQMTELRLDLLNEAPWNPNRQDSAMLAKLRESITRYGLVQNLVVRTVGNGTYEVLSGNQRLQVLREEGILDVPCVVVEVDDARARLLAQALNRVHGEDDLGLRAELVREVLETLPRDEVLSLLPETDATLQGLMSLGQEDMACYLQSWQQAQAYRLKHMQFQLTSDQTEVVEEAMARLLSDARDSQSNSPNARGTALYLLCLAFLKREETL